MCKMHEDVLNLHCSKCGCNEIHPINEMINTKNELGMTFPVKVYQCKKCKTKFLICPNCEGTGFTSGVFHEDYNDCSTCYGMGVVNLKIFKKISESI